MRRTIARIIALLLALLLTGGSGLALTDEELYQRGRDRMEAGDYLTAAEYFEALGDYLDSASLAKQTRERRSASFATPVPKKSKYSDYGVGQIVSFGRYEQDGNTKNGPEPIEWIMHTSLETEVPGDPCW